MKLWTKHPKRVAAAIALTAGIVGSVPLVLANDGILDVILSGQKRAAEMAQARGANSFFAPAPPQYAPPARAAPAPAVHFRVAPAQPRLAQQPKIALPPRARQQWAKITDAPPKSADDGIKMSLSELGSRAVCVRMCDGYHFPAGDVGSSADIPAQEALCQARCPAAPVRLFTLEAGQEIDDAKRGNQTYRNLPMAFAHQKKVDAACSCESGPTQARRVSLLKDLTLKKGDVVVLDAGAKVFNGAERWPYKSRDFSELKSSKALGVVAQKQIERVVGLAPPAAPRSLRGRGKSPDPAPASVALPEVEATASVPAAGPRKVRVIYSATDRYVASDVVAQQ